MHTKILSLPHLHQHDLWNRLLQRCVSALGFVHYKLFKEQEAALDEYLATISQHPPFAGWSDDQKIAYWLNAYNAFTIKLILNNYGVQSIKEIGSSEYSSPWKILFFKIGDEAHALDTIEHEILRKQFSEPRIHFCLVCASFSCPALRNEAYTAAKLEQQLENQAHRFINDPTKNELHSNPVRVSSLFKWYGEDFQKEFNDQPTMLSWINKYSDTAIDSAAPVEFLPNNCTLNGA